MPELPEVENIRRELNNSVIEKKIERVEVLRASVIKNTHQDYFIEVLTNNEFTYFDRRGKYLLGSLASGHMLVVHLGMTGQLYWIHPSEACRKHTHIILSLGLDKQLRYTDVRRFGKIYLLDDQNINQLSGLAKMGPEPLDKHFTLNKWLALFEKERTGPIKRWLLDQHFIAGVGNIYADEILYQAKISPLHPINDLNKPELARIYGAMGQVLRRAIAEGGSSISDYINAKGQKGGFQDSHNVYGKKDEPCPACGRPLSVCKVVGRTTTYCSSCQK